jgi:Phosphodiester glycosidase
MGHFAPQFVKQSLGIILTLGMFGSSVPVVWADASLQLSALSLQESSQIFINGKPFAGAWAKWTNPRSGQPELGISDSLWMRALGGKLLDSTNPTQQPVQWFSSTPKILSTQFNSNKTVRYLAISQAARQWGWQLETQGGVLKIGTGAAMAQSFKISRQPWGEQLVMLLDRIAPWRMTALTNSRSGKTDREFTLELDASFGAESPKTLAVESGVGLRTLKITPQQNQTLIQGTIKGDFQPQFSTLGNPPRLVLDMRQPGSGTRRLTWAAGLEWREAVVSVGQAQFPVTWLAIDPRQPRLKILPFWSGTTGVMGLEGLAKMAQRNQAAGAINAGYFGRDRSSPLGAIRRDGTWMSSPILNRGVMAWDAQGRFKVGRMMLQEQIVTSTGATLPITFSNSGYPQKGIARYTSLWGATYTPVLDKEQIITVMNNQVQSVEPAVAGQSVAIPKNGALLVARAMPVGPELAIGTAIQYKMQSSRPEFEAFPNIVGAGPVLVENGRVVVDAIAEQFSPPFAIQEADRSGIGQTADGTVLLVVTHNRIGGAGPTLGEWAQIMQRLGSINALNLDGGSSTTLYLGGQILDRHPSTAARVQNGIGIFFQPLISSSVDTGNIKQKSLK